MDESVRRKISLSKVGSKHSKETREKMSETRKQLWKKPTKEMKQVYKKLKKGIRKTDKQILFPFFEESFINDLSPLNLQHLKKINKAKTYLERFGYQYNILADFTGENTDKEIYDWILFGRFPTIESTPTESLILRSLEYAGLSNFEVEIDWEDNELESQIVIQFLNHEEKNDL